MTILDHIGNTPLVHLKNSSPNPQVNIYAKLEMCNPTGSLKDRIVMYMIDQAERRGELRPGMTIVEATSGNTGIALGMVAAVKDYKLKLFMLKTDYAITVETNNGTTPDDTFTLAAGGLVFYKDGDTLANTFTADVTALYVTNASGSTATVEVFAATDA